MKLLPLDSQAPSGNRAGFFGPLVSDVRWPEKDSEIMQDQLLVLGPPTLHPDHVSQKAGLK